MSQTDSCTKAETDNDVPSKCKACSGRLCIFAIFMSLFVMLAMPALFYIVAIFMPGPLPANKTVIVPKGTRVNEIASLLDETGIIINPLAFRIASRILAKDNLLAGEYLFPPEISIADAVATLRDGHSVLRKFTAAEGLTSSEIIELLNNDQVLTGGIGKNPPEGSLLPETYHYAYGDTRKSIIDRMSKKQNETINDLWERRDPDIAIKSKQEAIILASIIEKETGKKAEERARVAGVFYNRLRIGMRLQSDPTVIYALTEGKNSLSRPLTRNDLDNTQSPFNTYLNEGLPPSPICNPGRAAIEATLHPEKNDYIYFVADGTGGHAFSSTLPEHNRNVGKWNKINREIRKTSRQ